jgi:N-glycosidase YbiA
MRDKVLFYGGEFGYGFSNFAAFNVEWKGRVWMTSEHAYQASKFDIEDIVNEIHSAKSSHEALKLASEKYINKMRATWNEEEKLAVMYDIISHKHDQHPYIQKQLKQSGEAELVENSEKDSFWGVAQIGRDRIISESFG